MRTSDLPRPPNAAVHDAPRPSAQEARALFATREAEREAIRAAVEAEALPLLQDAWAADPGRIHENALLGRRFMRVGLVERRTDERGTFDLVWLDTLVYRPFADAPDLVLEEGTGDEWRLTLTPSFGSPSAPLTMEAGPVWFREVGRFLQNKRYFVPWIHCGINQRPGEEGRVDRLAPRQIDAIDAIVLPSAIAWMEANGGPVFPPEPTLERDFGQVQP